MYRWAFSVIAFVVFGLAAAASGVFESTICTHVDRAKIQMRGVAMAIDAFTIDTGSLPVNLEQLLSAEIQSWDGPYIRARNLFDPWGEPWIYRISTIDTTRYVLAFIPPETVEIHRADTVLYRRAEVTVSEHKLEAR